MLNLGTALIAALTVAASPAAHETQLDHKGTTYRVSYQPRLDTSMKTIGAHAGTRMSVQRCRWTMDVQVERHIHAADHGNTLARMLPATHSISGERQGSCQQNRAAIAADREARMQDVHTHVAALAEADRGAALATIETAHALALN